MWVKSHTDPRDLFLLGRSPKKTSGQGRKSQLDKSSVCHIQQIRFLSRLVAAWGFLLFIFLPRSPPQRAKVHGCIYQSSPEPIWGSDRTDHIVAAVVYKLAVASCFYRNKTPFLIFCPKGHDSSVLLYSDWLSFSRWNSEFRLETSVMQLPYRDLISLKIQKTAYYGPVFTASC